MRELQPMFTGYSLHSVAPISTRLAEGMAVDPHWNSVRLPAAMRMRLRAAFYGQLVYRARIRVALPTGAPGTFAQHVERQHRRRALASSQAPPVRSCGDRAGAVGRQKRPWMHRLHRMPLAPSLAPDGGPSLRHTSGPIILPGERDLPRIRRAIRPVRVTACEQ
jgi:hypothetical protein